MGIRPCTATTTTPLGTVVTTSFSPVTNVFSITITPIFNLDVFCVNVPCAVTTFTSCTGNACSLCRAGQAVGVGAAPLFQPAGQTQTYTFTFSSAATFTAGTAVTDFTYNNGQFEPGVEIPCAPVCVM
ncbi:hypothetical protein [Neobacillus mesonae]|uniref:Uncharacterized protein n=1 Tax=Neobacillus mesonae TaxID=1193713 RepID=A0A3Q9QSV7_9BACI|nr:hypothetical protein [Neobacillus mesonae]AZU62491.1 hypothetical protein CHR53_15075 [Neobacillus mesonae]